MKKVRCRALFVLDRAKHTLKEENAGASAFSYVSAIPVSGAGGSGVWNMWYVIQTTTGKEQELVGVIKKLLPAELYESCFFFKRQLLKRLGGKWLEITETLFPAYVFLETERPEAVFFALKKVPEFAKLLGDRSLQGNDGMFIPLYPDEESFLNKLCEEETDREQDFRLVRLTDVQISEDGEKRKFSGPLSQLQERIERLNLRKRYAVVSFSVCGERQTAILGIRLKKNQEGR